MSGDINCKSNFVSYVLADVIIFVYEVSLIFWHYINVDEVSWMTLKKLLHSAMELLQIATGITKCDDYYKLRQYTRSDLLVSHQPFAHWRTPTKASVVKLSQIEKISFLLRSKCTDKIYKWKVEVERVLSCRFVGEWKGQATNLPWRTSSLFLPRRLSLQSFFLGEQKLSLKP